MSFPYFPNVTPTISLTTAQVVPLLLGSIAFEELALAHMINAEAEKLQMVLGTLPGGTPLSPATVSVTNLIDIDKSVQRTLKDIIKKEMLLEFKFENILDLVAITSIISPTPPPSPECPCSFHLVTQGNPTTTATITNPAASTLTGGININVLECFPNCNPNSDNYTVTFNGETGETINFARGGTSGRIAIACNDSTSATVTGFAQASGNVTGFTGLFTITISLDTTTGLWTVDAIGENGSTFSTSFTGSISPATTISSCF